MRRILSQACLVWALFAAWGAAHAYYPEDFDGSPEVIAFGSCNREGMEQPLWPVIAAERPDLWIWGGDNIYGDSKREEVIREAYRRQLSHPGYAVFRAAFPIIGTWDDHDYGWNNAGREYPIKQRTQQLALDFMDVPPSDPRRSRAGIYGTYAFGEPGRRVRVILLDNRYFATAKDAEAPDLLGDAQRAWLRETLGRSEADVHVIVSGIQVLSSEHKWDHWGHYPRDRAFLLALLREEAVPGAVLLSGDRHIHEISVLEREGAYPLMDVTSSGLTHSWSDFPGEPNRLRAGEVYTGLGYGVLRIDWEARPLEVRAAIRDRSGQTVRSHTVRFSR